MSDKIEAFVINGEVFLDATHTGIAESTLRLLHATIPGSVGSDKDGNIYISLQVLIDCRRGDTSALETFRDQVLADHAGQIH